MKRRKRPKQINCKSGFVQRGAACQKPKPKKKITTKQKLLASAITAGLVGAGVATIASRQTKKTLQQSTPNIREGLANKASKFLDKFPDVVKNNKKKVAATALGTSVVATGIVLASRNRIPPEPKVNEEDEPTTNTEKTIREVENKLRHDSKETLIAFNPKTGQTTYTKQGDEQSVPLSDADYDALKGSITTHNHPYQEGSTPLYHMGLSFSLSDCWVACRAEKAETRVVTAGYRFSLKPPKEGWNEYYYNAILKPTFRQNESRILFQYQTQIRKGKITAEQASEEISHEIMRVTSEQLGLGYSRKKIKGMTRKKVMQERKALGLTGEIRKDSGKVWVKDPRKKGGGYWRRIGRRAKKVGGAIASQLLGAAVVGTGAALATKSAINAGQKKAGTAANEIAQTFGKQINNKAITGAAVGGLVVGAAGAAAIANRNKRKDSVDVNVLPKLDPEKRTRVLSLLRLAIRSVFPSIRNVIDYRLQPNETIIGFMKDKRNRIFAFDIFQDGRITYGNPEQRGDKIADICKNGIQCGQSCVSAKDRCKQNLSPQAKTTTDIARDIIITGELPSRKEIAKLAAQGAKATTKTFIKTVQEKGLKAAAVELVEEGNKRERLVRETAKTMGVNTPTKKEAVKQGVKFLASKPDVVVNTMGYLGSQAGGVIAGPLGALAGDLGGALITRKAYTDIEASKLALQKLQTTEEFQNANKLSKIKQLTGATLKELESPEMQERVEDLMREDKTGWAIGNAVATVPVPIPLKGAAVAMASASNVSQKIKEKGIAQTAKELPSDTVKAIANIPKRLKNAVHEGNARERKMREQVKQNIKSAQLVTVDLDKIGKRKDSKQDELMHSVMSRYKKRKLHIGKSDKIVKRRKQAIAIGLSVSGQSRKV